MIDFPIQGTRTTGPTTIPWSFIAPHDRTAQANHGGQSLARLAQRGGLSPSEAWYTLNDKPHLFTSEISEADALTWIKAHTPPPPGSMLDLLERLTTMADSYIVVIEGEGMSVTDEKATIAESRRTIQLLRGT